MKVHLASLLILFFSLNPSVSSEVVLFQPHLPGTASMMQPPLIPPPEVFHGVASWYSQADPYINKHTANGEVFDDTRLTCASWKYSFNTLLKVTNVSNGESVICRVNDRGPAKRLNRIIDLSKGAFVRIASLKKGLIDVSVSPLVEL